jgi:hypothetical protein
MKRIIICCFLLSSCASTVKVVEQPLKYSYLPEKIDIEQLMPPNVNIVDTTLNDFKSVAIDSGRLTTIYRDTLQLHPGILFSEKKAALFIYYRNNGEYLDKKLSLVKKLYNDYYDNSLEAEKVYQNEIINLNKKAERTWLEKNIVYLGFIAGLATAILTEFAIMQTPK